MKRRIFPEEFFEVLLKLSFPPHAIYWAYDEMRSLTSVQILSKENLFGRNQRNPACFYALLSSCPFLMHLMTGPLASESSRIKRHGALRVPYAREDKSLRFRVRIESIFRIHSHVPSEQLGFAGSTLSLPAG